MKPLRVFDRRVVEREIEEELRFHLDLLTQEHLEQNMSPAAAQSLAGKRFGDLQEIKSQCADIRKRSNPLMRTVKSLLFLALLAGVFIRISGTELEVRRMGVLLIAIPILTRLLLYVRALRPSDFRFKSRDSSVLGVSSAINTPRAN